VRFTARVSTVSAPPSGIAWERVEEEVDQHLLQPIEIARDVRQILAELELRLHARVRELSREQLDGRVDEAVEADVAALVGPDLAAREVEQALDDARDARGLLGDDAGVLSTASGSFDFFLDRARAARDHVERRADLVRDLGRELTDRRELLALGPRAARARSSPRSAAASPRATRAARTSSR